jgi:hypothetical protein
MSSGERLVEWYRTHGRPPKRTKRVEAGKLKADDDAEQSMANIMENLRYEHKGQGSLPSAGVQYLLQEAPELLGPRGGGSGERAMVVRRSAGGMTRQPRAWEGVSRRLLPA